MSQQSLHTRDNIFKRSAPRGFDFIQPQFRSPQQLPRALSPSAILNNRMGSPGVSKNEGMSSTTSSYQWRFDKEKSNGVQQQPQQMSGIFITEDVSMESLQKRLETFFAATKNFIYSATKMKADMSAVINDYDQQIDFSAKLFEADKLSLEKSLGKVESQLFRLKDLGETQPRDYGSPSSKSLRSPQRDQSNQLQQQQQQNQDDIRGSSLQYERIRLENRELKLQVAKLRNEIESISLRKQDSNVNAVNELESLKKQVGKIERKANERKICIKRLYSLLELKDKDLENLKGFKSTYPIPALTNFISALNSHDTSRKLQNYLDMSAKEAKLRKMLQREDSALSGSKKVEIEDMIEFLKVEQQDVISHFSALVSTQPISKSPRLRPAQPNISQNYSGLLGSPSLHQDGNTSRNQAYSSKSMPRSRESSQHFSPTNVPRMRSQEPYKQQFQQQQLQVQQNSSKNQEDLEWVLKEQADQIKRKFLEQFEQILAELIFPETPPRLPEDQLIARVRDEFSSQLKKINSLMELIEEQRRAIGSREEALIVSQEEIQHLQQDIMIKEEQLIANNPRLMQLEEEVQQLNDQRNAADQELVDLSIREKAYLEEIDKLKEELFMVLDNLKISMETAGLIDEQEEKNVEDMLNTLRSFLETQQQMVHLHSDVYSDMERKIVQLNEEIELLKEERTSLIDEIQRMEENNLRLQEDHQQLGVSEQDKRSDLEEKIQKLEQEIYSIRQNGLAPEIVEQLQYELEQKQTALEQAMEHVENLQQSIHTLNLQAVNREKEIEKMKGQLVRSEEEQKHRGNIAQSLEKCQNDIRARNAEMSIKVDEMELIQGKLNRKNQELEQELNKMKEQKRISEIETQKLQKTNEDKIVSLSQTIKDLEQSCNQSQDKLAASSRQNQQFEKELRKIKREQELMMQAGKQSKEEQELIGKYQNTNKISQEKQKTIQESQKYLEETQRKDQQIIDLQAQNDTKAKELIGFNDRIDQLQDVIRDLEGRNRQESEEKEGIQQKYEELLKEKQQDIDELISQLEEAKRKKAKQGRQQGNKEEEKGFVDSNIPNINGISRNVEGDVEKQLALVGEIKELKGLLLKSQQELKETQGQYQVLSIKYENSQKQMQAERLQLDESLGKLKSEKNGEIKALQGDLEVSRNELKNSKEQQNLLNEQLQETQENLKDLNSKLQDSEEKLKKYIQQLQESERNLQEAKSILQESSNRLKQAESELNNFQRKEEKLREQLKTKDEEINKLRGVIEEQHKEKQSRQQMDKQKATQEKSQQEKQIKEENEQLNMLQAVNDSLKSSLASSEQNLEDAKQQIESLNHNLEVLKNENNESQSRIVELSREVQMITNENLQLNQKISEINGNYEQSQNLLKQKQKDNEQLIVNLNKLKDQTEKQINELATKNQENQRDFEEKLKEKETAFKQAQENQETQWNEKIKRIVLELKDAQELECQEIRKYAEQDKIQNQQKQQELIEGNEKLTAENGQLIKEISDLNEKIKQLGKELLDKGQVNQRKQEQEESGNSNVVVPRISARRAGYEKKEGKSCGSHSSRYSGASSERFRIQQLQQKEQQQQQQVQQPALGGIGLRLNLENVVVGGGEEDRMHIRRDRGKGEQEIHEGQIDEKPNGSSASDEDEFKQGVIEIQSKKMEEQVQEINDLKHQIDLMFEDLADKDGYIQHLEQLLDQKELENQQIKVDFEAQMQNNMQQPIQQQQQKQLETTKVPTPVGSPKNSDQLKSQLSTATLQLKQLKIQVSELMSANDELETRIDEKENKILELQENQHGESAEEQIGVLTEQLDKARQKARRHEEDLVYQQQVVQQQRQRIEELEKKLGMDKRNSKDNYNNDEDDNDSNEGDLVKQLGLNKEKPQQQVSSQLPQQLPQFVQKNFSSNEDVGKSGTEGDALSSGRSPNNSGVIGMRNRNELRYDQITRQQQVNQQQQQSQNKQNLQGQPIQLANSAKSQEGKRTSKQIFNTAEAEQLEEMLIVQKINLQQQIAELKSEFEFIPEEDHIRIQELEQQLEHNKKEFAKLYEQASSKQVMANMNDKYLSLQQMYKELKEDRENIKQNLDSMIQGNNQIVNVIQSTIPNQYSNIANDIQMEPISMVNKLSELYKSAQLNIHQLQQQLDNLNPKSSRTKNDNNHINSNNQDNNINNGFMQVLQNLLDTVLINKKVIDEDFEEEARQTLPQDLADRIKQYISSVIELLHMQMSLKMEADQLQQKVQELSEQLEKLKNTNKNIFNAKNDEFQVIVQKAPLVMSQDPFDPQDLEKLRREQQKQSSNKKNNNNDNFKLKDNEFQKVNQNGNLLNDENNDSSFLSMSEQIIKELDGNSSKNIQVPTSAHNQQTNAIIKQFEDQINLLKKENEEIKASNDYLTSRQDELFDEIKAKDDIIQTTELALKSLKKELKKQKENTEAVEQKEHLKKIFLQFLYAISDKKKQMEAEEFIYIIFSMLGIAEKEKEQLIDHLAPKQADKKKSIIALLLKK